MKKLLLILFFSSLAFSQQEASVWYFGQNAGIKYNNDGTITTLTDGQLDTLEGCATIADANGDLLFYTDGKTVWNKNHLIMVNGTGLMGDLSTTQSATIVPKPGSTTLFYIFTLDANAGVNGFRYSEVDISLSGGLGAVTTNKNILIYTPTNEKLSIVKHVNNTDFWIVTHGWNNNSFYSYLLTSSGLNVSPTISNTGFLVSGSTDNTWGYMKIAPDGSKLAISHALNNVELFDFDIATGVVSNPLTIFTGTSYGVEFSENSSVLYVSVTDPAPYKIIQYDLTSSNIIGTAQLVYNSTITPAALQLGPDNKIYIAQFNKTKLGVINSPNVIGMGCNVQMNAVDLAGKICNFGLPPFITSLFNTSFTAQNLCLGNFTQFNFNSSQPIIGVLWDFGDGFTSTGLNPTHQYANPGTYNVSMTVTTSTGTFTKNRQIIISSIPVIVNTIANQVVCGSANMNFNLSQFNAALLGSQSTSLYGVAYFTSSIDANTHTNLISTSYSLPIGVTTLFVKVYNLSNANCFAVTSFSINLIQQPIANTANGIFICDDVSNDGIANFTLQNNASAILGSQSTSDYTVSYHTSQNNADLDVNPLSLNYQNTSNPQTIYARIENNLSASCFATTTFQIGLYQMPIANQPQNLYECDAGNDGTESFDLSIQNATILGSQLPINFAVSYHSSQADANSGSNPLTNSITVLNSKTIFVRVVNVLSASCFATSVFDLIIKPNPILTLNNSYTICQGNSITITAPTGFSSYTWSNGATTPITTITQAGNYTLTVTLNHGPITCSDTKTITVVNSTVATIASIETLDWTDTENSITVYVTIPGNYEYSLDGLFYQDSPSFYGLISGQYTVYVRDKNGCGVVQEDLFLLMYPKFFTPNGDGINDHWKIKFSNAEPDMIVYVYDRYGKLVKQLSGTGNGWDGASNGQQLIADDYWFVVKRENGKEHKGHFTLKR